MTPTLTRIVGVARAIESATTARLFRTLSDETRLKILWQLQGGREFVECNTGLLRSVAGFRPPVSYTRPLPMSHSLISLHN